MDTIKTKPKLLFFQRRYEENVPEFLLMQIREHVKCLSHFFEVIVIRDDCDYQQVCDIHQPDLTLFESGPNLVNCHRLKIVNIRACPDIPKLGFINADAWDATRAGILSEMDHWGIETFFSIAITAAEHTPVISEKLFSWPNFIDPEIFHDYSESKIIPVLFTGSQASQYPWRAKIYKLVSKHHPSLFCPHTGYYQARAATGQMIYGEHYARLINASLLVPTCGTVAKEVVRKHFEIPASKACLITEKSPGLEAAGFVDMVNCIFTDEHDLLDKIDHLLRNPDECERITNAGYSLAHSRHTLKQRDQIFQWFNLQKNLKSDQKIIQLNPFDALTIVKQNSGINSSHIVSGGLHLVLLRQGDENLWAKKYEEAESFYLKSLNYTSMLPEAKFRLALCSLYRGNPKMALSWIMAPIQYTLAGYKASDPDPVEWAWFIISLLCLGKVNSAIRRASQFPWLSHPELDRVRLIINVLKNKGIMTPVLEQGRLKYRYSIHELPCRSFNEWVEELCTILKTCQQYDIADRLMKGVCIEVISSAEIKRASSSVNKYMLMKQNGNINEAGRMQSLYVFGKEAIKNCLDEPVVYFRFLQKWANLRQRVEHLVLQFLHRLEAKYGYFLPYRLSKKKDDELFHAIARVTRYEDIKTALVIGAAIGEGATDTFLAEIIQNWNAPSVFCVNGSTRRFVNLEKTFSHNPHVRCYQVPDSALEDFPSELEKTIKKIKEENEVAFFDVILIDPSRLIYHEASSSQLKKEVRQAKYVILNHIDFFCNFENKAELIKDPNYILVAYNANLRGGYAIFEKDSSMKS